MSTEKKRLSETEDKLILGIPLLLRLRPIVVQPQPVVITIQVEDIRVTVLVRSVYRAI